MLMESDYRLRCLLACPQWPCCPSAPELGPRPTHSKSTLIQMAGVGYRRNDPSRGFIAIKVSPTNTILAYCPFVLVPFLCHTLTKIHFDPAIINQHIIHLYVASSQLSLLSNSMNAYCREAPVFIADHVARPDVPKTRKNQLRLAIVLCSICIQQNILGWRGIRIKIQESPAF